jgi:hypothetical protein
MLNKIGLIGGGNIGGVLMSWPGKLQWSISKNRIWPKVRP